MKNDDRFAHILEKYGDTVYRIALVRLQNREDAEDVFQESFYRLLRSENYLNWDDEHIKAWLIKVALNCCRDLRRKSEKETALTENELRTISGNMSSEEFGIWEIVNTLDEPDRSLIHMFYGEELPLKECAKALGLTYGNARVIIHRARKKLRRKIQ